MEKSRKMEREAVIAVGVGLLLFAGVVGLVSVMFDWLPDSQPITIEPKQGFVVNEILGRSWGHLDISYSTQNGSSVLVVVMDEEQYRNRGDFEGSDAMYEHTGPAGDFSSKVDFETYYLVFARLNLTHISVAELEQPIEIQCTISLRGVNPILAAVSGVFAATGLGLVVVGLVGGAVRKGV